MKGGGIVASVRLENITKMFGETTAVDDITLDISDGEFVVLLGPSGCGKTTTLRIVSGLEVQSTGHVFIGDKLVDDIEPKDRNVAMVFQSYALYPHLTIFNNIAFGLKARRTPRSEIISKVNETARMLQIHQLLDRKPSALSGGQRQRVALARALVRDPQVFLLDEPLSNLDAKLRAATRIELKNLHNRLGRTMIYVTHDQVEAMTLADKIAVINQGRLLQFDSPLEIFQHPAHRFVADFVGYPSMNMLEGDVRDSAGGKVFASEELQFSVTGIASGRYVLGIRPTDVEVTRRSSEGSVECKVRGLERTGSDNYLFLDSDLGALVASVPLSDYSAGDTVYLRFDLTKAHFFDTSTGTAVVASAI